MELVESVTGCSENLGSEDGIFSIVSSVRLDGDAEKLMIFEFLCGSSFLDLVGEENCSSGFPWVWPVWLDLLDMQLAPINLNTQDLTL